MTHFRTDVSIPSSPYKIGLNDPILTAGSCFADAIGLRLTHNKFKTLANPFGVLYNPVSIHKALRYAIHQEPPADHTYLSSHGLSVNYDFHSEFSHTEKSALVSQIQNSIGSSHFFLKDA